MRITEQVHALKTVFQIDVAPGVKIHRSVYSYLLLGQGVHAIDTGVASSYESIVSCLRAAGRAIEELKTIVLTHSHPDHIGSALLLQRASGCKVVAHAAEREWIEDTAAQARQRPVPGFESLVAGAVRVDRVVEDGEMLVLEPGLALEVRHTPGHSAGSISLLLGNAGILFCGDALPLPGDLPIYEDLPALIVSLRRLREMPGLLLLLPAWGEPVSGSCIPDAMDQSLCYVQRIHEMVLRTIEHGVSTNPLEFCKRVLEGLDLTNVPPNSLLAKTFHAHLALRQCPDLAKWQGSTAERATRAEPHRGAGGAEEPAAIRLAFRRDALEVAAGL